MRGFVWLVGGRFVWGEDILPAVGNSGTGRTGRGQGKAEKNKATGIKMQLGGGGGEGRDVENNFMFVCLEVWVQSWALYTSYKWMHGVIPFSESYKKSRNLEVTQSICFCVRG
jgi:hypothetical protein